jgi:hypothetical protein
MINYLIKCPVIISICSKLVSHQGHLIIFNVIDCGSIVDVDKRKIVDGGGVKRVIVVLTLFDVLFKLVIG